MSPLGPNAYEAFVDLFKLHEAREWRAIVKRGDSLVAAVASSPASIELRPHAEAMCADAMLHDSATIEGLERFAVAGPDPAELSKTFHALGIDVTVVRGEEPQLRASIAGPKGKLEVSS